MNSSDIQVFRTLRIRRDGYSYTGNESFKIFKSSWIKVGPGRRNIISSVNERSQAIRIINMNKATMIKTVANYCGLSA